MFGVWGISEAMDLYQEYIDAFQRELTIITIPASATAQSSESSKNAVDEGDEQKPAGEAKQGIDMPRHLNILLFGDNDPRHVIKTMAKLFQHKYKAPDAVGDGGKYQTPSIHFYVCEGLTETFARYMLLLAIALEHPGSIELIDKINVFMDVYGNSLLSPSSSHYVADKGRLLAKLINDGQLLAELAPMLDIKDLVKRDLNGLTYAFNFWLPLPSNNFAIKELWTLRNEQAFGEAYRARRRKYNEDLLLKLRERTANRICHQEYLEWRETGVGLTFANWQHTHPNKTLAAGVRCDGEKYLDLDTGTGPYCAFGLQTTNEKIMRSAYFRATDITAINLEELFYELQVRQPFRHDATVAYSYLLNQLPAAKDVLLEFRTDNDIPWIHVEGIKVHFTSVVELLGQNGPREGWHRFFDVVFVGQSFHSALDAAFLQILRPNALLLVETKLRTLASEEAVIRFHKWMLSFAESNKLFGQVRYAAMNTRFPVLKFKKIKGG